MNVQDVDGRTLLHRLSAQGDLRGLLEQLEKLEEEQILNIRDSAGWTALHSASSCGYLEIVKALLENGANPEVETDRGALPLHYGRFLIGLF